MATGIEFHGIDAAAEKTLFAYVTKWVYGTTSSNWLLEQSPKDKRCLQQSHLYIWVLDH